MIVSCSSDVIPRFSLVVTFGQSLGGNPNVEDKTAAVKPRGSRPPRDRALRGRGCELFKVVAANEPSIEVGANGRNPAPISLLPESMFYFFGLCFAAAAACFFCLAVLFLSCFCLACFWTDLGDRSPIYIEV